MWGVPYPERPRIVEMPVEIETLVLYEVPVEVPVITERVVEIKVPEVPWCPVCWIVRLWRRWFSR